MSALFSHNKPTDGSVPLHRRKSSLGSLALYWRPGILAITAGILALPASGFWLGWVAMAAIIGLTPAALAAGASLVECSRRHPVILTQMRSLATVLRFVRLREPYLWLFGIMGSITAAALSLVFSLALIPSLVTVQEVPASFAMLAALYFLGVAHIPWLMHVRTVRAEVLAGRDTVDHLVRSFEQDLTIRKN